MTVLKNDSVEVLPLNPVYSVLRVEGYQASENGKMFTKSWRVIRLYQSQNYWKAYHFWKARRGTCVVLVSE